MTAILPLLGLGVLKVLVLLSSAAVSARTLAKRPARLRAIVWATALAGTLIMPAVGPLLPKMELPMPAVFDTPVPTSSVPHRVTLPVQEAVFEHTTSPSPKSSTQRTALTTKGWRLTWPSGLLILWALGATALLSHLAMGLFRVSRTVRSASKLTDQQWQSLLANAATRVGFRRRVRLLISPEVEVPATVGLLKPTVLIPAYGRDWSEDRRLAVLLHELVHVRRADWAIRILARTARAFYWFIPLTWWATRRLDLEQELACDEEVVALGTRPADYADHLLGIARSAVLNPSPAIPTMAMARTPDLEKRIMTLLKNTSHRRVGIAVLIPAVLLVAAMVSALAAVAPLASSAPMDPPAAPADPTSPTNPEIGKIVAEMEAAEKEVEKEMERVELRGLEIEKRMEMIEPIEIDEDAMAKIEAAMEPHLERIREIELAMEPLEVDMEKIEIGLQNLELHIEDGTLEEVQKQVQEQIGKHLETIHLSHEALRPHLEELEMAHLEMEGLHEQLEKFHLAMEPDHEALKKLHRELEPWHEEMERIHREMEPFHQRMEELGERLEDAIADEVAGRLRSSLGVVTSPGTSFDEAARRIIDRGAVRIHDDVITVNSSFDENKEILQDLFGGRRIGTEEAFNDAVTAAASEMANLRISVK